MDADNVVRARSVWVQVDETLLREGCLPQWLFDQLAATLAPLVSNPDPQLPFSPMTPSPMPSPMPSFVAQPPPQPSFVAQPPPQPSFVAQPQPQPSFVAQPPPASNATLVLLQLARTIAQKRWVECRLEHRVGGALQAPPFELEVTVRATVGNTKRDVCHLLEVDPSVLKMKGSVLDFRLRFNEITKNLGGNTARLCIECAAKGVDNSPSPNPAVAYTRVKSREARKRTGLARFFPKGTFGSVYLARFEKAGIATREELAALPNSGSDFEAFVKSVRQSQGSLTPEILVEAIHRARVNKPYAQEDSEPDMPYMPAQAPLPQHPPQAPPLQPDSLAQAFQAGPEPSDQFQPIHAASPRSGPNGGGGDDDDDVDDADGEVPLAQLAPLPPRLVHLMREENPNKGTGAAATPASDLSDDEEVGAYSSLLDNPAN